VRHGDLGLDHVQLLDDGRLDAGRPYFFDFLDCVRGPVALELAIMLPEAGSPTALLTAEPPR